jgi:hypothetical protein
VGEIISDKGRREVLLRRREGVLRIKEGDEGNSECENGNVIELDVEGSGRRSTPLLLDDEASNDESSPRVRLRRRRLRDGIGGRLVGGGE